MGRRDYPVAAASIGKATASASSGAAKLKVDANKSRHLGKGACVKGRKTSAPLSEFQSIALWRTKVSPPTHAKA